jgi:hypothetical protein
VRGKGALSRYQQDTILLLATTAFFAMAVLVVKMVREFDSVPRATTQARFLFPALTPIAILMMAGLLRLTPERYHIVLVRLTVAGLLALNVLSLARHILPFYYGV